jgi:hypothetical protein
MHDREFSSFFQTIQAYSEAALLPLTTSHGFRLREAPWSKQ